MVEVPREIFGIKIPGRLPSSALGDPGEYDVEGLGEYDVEDLGEYDTGEIENQYSFDNPEEEIHSGTEVEIYPERGTLDEFSVISPEYIEGEDEIDELGDPYDEYTITDYEEYPEEMALEPESDGTLAMDEEVEDLELGVNDFTELEEEFET